MPRTRCGDPAIALVVVAIVVAACGGAAVGSASPGTSEEATPVAPTPTPTPKPTPTPVATIDIGALGEAYVAIGKDLSETVGPLLDDLDSGVPDDQIISDCKAVADAYGTAADAYAALEFPEAVQADAADLVELMGQFESLFRQCAADPTYSNVDAFNALLPQVTEIGGRIRAALGLPPPPTAPPG